MLFGVLPKLTLVAQCLYPVAGYDPARFPPYRQPGDDSAPSPPMERFFFYLSDVISDRMPRVSDVYRAQGAPYEQYQPNLAYIRNNPNLAYIGNRREYQSKRWSS